MKLAEHLFVGFGALSSHLPAFRGRNRAFLSLFKLLGLKDSHAVAETTLQRPVPFHVRLDLHSWLQRLAFVNGSYEEDTVMFLYRLYSSHQTGGYSLDIGANIGLISIPLCLMMRKQPPCRIPSVVSIEAASDNAAALRANIALNDLDREISVIDSPVGDAVKDVFIQVEGDLEKGEGSGTASILPDGSTYDCVRQQIALTTLDSLVEQRKLAQGCSVIKIDTDGYDLKVLQGGKQMMMTDRPIVFGEFAAHCLRWHGQSLKDVIDFATGLDYSVWQQQPKSWLFGQPGPADRFVQNLLLVPRERADALKWCIQP